jgi:hypothetical protein
MGTSCLIIKHGKRFQPLFSLAQEAQRKPTSQAQSTKKKRRWECRPLRRATKGIAFGNRELLKKLDQNFRYIYGAEGVGTPTLAAVSVK